MKFIIILIYSIFNSNLYFSFMSFSHKLIIFFFSFIFLEYFKKLIDSFKHFSASCNNFTSLFLKNLEFLGNKL